MEISAHIIDKIFNVMFHLWYFHKKSFNKKLLTHRSLYFSTSWQKWQMTLVSCGWIVNELSVILATYMLWYYPLFCAEWVLKWINIAWMNNLVWQIPYTTTTAVMFCFHVTTENVASKLLECSLLAFIYACRFCCLIHTSVYFLQYSICVV